MKKKLKCLACDALFPYKKDWNWCPKCKGVLVEDKK